MANHQLRDNIIDKIILIKSHWQLEFTCNTVNGRLRLPQKGYVEKCFKNPQCKLTRYLKLIFYFILYTLMPMTSSLSVDSELQKIGCNAYTTHLHPSLPQKA